MPPVPVPRGPVFRDPAARAAVRAGVAILTLAARLGAQPGAPPQSFASGPQPPAQVTGGVPTTTADNGVNGGCTAAADCPDPYPHEHDRYNDRYSNAPPSSALGPSASGADRTATLGVSAGVGPVVTLVSPTLYRDPALCAQDCGELVKTYTTPSYVSRDVARSLTLVYRSGRARPRPVIELDVEQAAGASTPDRIGLKLFDVNGAAVPLNAGTTEAVRRYAPGKPNRLSAQVVTGGVVSYTAVVTAYDAAGGVLGQTSVPVVVLSDAMNGLSSPYGIGWGVPASSAGGYSGKARSSSTATAASGSGGRAPPPAA